MTRARVSADRKSSPPRLPRHLQSYSDSSAPAPVPPCPSPFFFTLPSQSSPFAPVPGSPCPPPSPFRGPTTQSTHVLGEGHERGVGDVVPRDGEVRRCVHRDSERRCARDDCRRVICACGCVKATVFSMGGRPRIRGWGHSRGNICALVRPSCSKSDRLNWAEQETKSMYPRADTQRASVWSRYRLESTAGVQMSMRKSCSACNPREIAGTLYTLSQEKGTEEETPTHLGL